MTRREIFHLVSLVCLGIFVLIGTYLWKESRVYSNEKELERHYYARQTQEMAEANEAQSPSKSSTNDTSNPGTSTANPTPANPGSAAQQLTSAGAAPTPAPLLTAPSTPTQPDPTPTANNIVAPGCKVGDIVKLGDVEMVVTKTTNKHKVIDITIMGNTSGKQPKRVLVEPNRIIYEILEDVDINVDLTEKTVIEESPISIKKKK